MNCRAKIILRSLLLVFVCLSVTSLIAPPFVQAATALISADATAARVSSPHITTVSRSAKEQIFISYPKPFVTLMGHLSRWKPKRDVTEECVRTFSSVALAPEKCLADYKLNIIDSYTSKILFDFDLESETFQKIIFEPQAGYKFRGLLGLHQGKKRPLVIFRMGVHGNIDEFLAERFIIQILYQELGYHVLAIESNTSHGYLKINSRFSFGAVEEALQTFYVENLITHKKISWAKDVSDLYLMAVSMGGAGTFLATYLDEQTQQKIKAVQMFCPLVNVEQTFQYHFRPGLKSAVIDFWNSRRMQEVENKNPELAQINFWPMLLDWKPRFAPRLLQWLDRNEPKPILRIETFKEQFPDVKFPADFLAHVEKSQGLYQLNNFWPIFKNTKTPIRIVTTGNDPLVINQLNAEMISQGQQPGIFEKTTVKEMKGLHCALASEYQWPFLIEWMRRGFEGNSLKK